MLECTCSTPEEAMARGCHGGLNPTRRWQICQGIAEGVSVEDCERYRQLWTQEPYRAFVRPVLQQRTLCKHLGKHVRTDAKTFKKQECNDCSQKTPGQTVYLDVFHCNHPEPAQTMAVLDQVTGIRETTLAKCRAPCPGYGGRGRKIETRNLLYHVYPVAGNGVWQRNVLQLLKRISLFNGQRVIAIVVDDKTDPPQAVQSLFRGEATRFILAQNNPGLREVMTFLPLLEAVDTDDESQATFYAHTKGVTRPVTPGVTPHEWTRLMYEACLDYWPAVERSLEQHSTVGAFRKRGHCFTPSPSAWHYTGAFWWYRNADLHQRNWRRIDGIWYGGESYPGLHFTLDEADWLLWDDVAPRPDLYAADQLQDALQRHERWKVEHVQDRSGRWQETETGIRER